MKLKQWADALQSFVLRALSSLFLTYLAVYVELYTFAITHGTYELKCETNQGYSVAALLVWWLCFHLLVYRKEQS